jgi:hypothetical protein
MRLKAIVSLCEVASKELIMMQHKICDVRHATAFLLGFRGGGAGRNRTDV